jgi:hypothetical protein
MFPPHRFVRRAALTTIAVGCMMMCQSGSPVRADNGPLIRTVWGDLDGDGRPDQVFIDHHGDVSNIAVFASGLREGQTLSTDSTTSSVIAVDIDGDGDLDLLAASPNGSELWLNDGHGVFTATRVPSERRLLAPAGIESVAPFRPFAVCTTLLSTEPTISSPRSRAVSIRAPARDPWVSSTAFLSHLLRAPPSIFTLI